MTYPDHPAYRIIGVDRAVARVKILTLEHIGHSTAIIIGLQC